MAMRTGSSERSPQGSHRLKLLALVGAIAIVPIFAVATSQSQHEGGGRAGAETDAVSPPLSDRGADSRAAWQALWVQARELENYPDLESMTDRASLVVDGTIESVEAGRTYALDDLGVGGAVKYVLASIRVDELLAGAGTSKGELVKLELGPVAYQDDISAVKEGLKGDRGIFFLRLKGGGVPHLGIQGDRIEAKEGFYRVVSSQGIFLDDNGVVRLGLYYYEEGFPADLQGDPFETFEARVEMLGE